MLLLVEDDISLSGHIAEYLRIKGENVAQAFNARECQDFINNQIESFELILLDIMLPDGDGLSLLSQIREVSKIPVILITALSGEQRVIEALNSGADDYLVKPFHPELLLARTRAIKRRIGQHKPLHNELEFLKNKKILIFESNRSISVDGKDAGLSTTEFDIFITLAKNRGNVVSRNQLFERTKGKLRHSSDRSIDIQISRIRSKLNIEDEIKTIWGKGYMLIDESL